MAVSEAKNLVVIHRIDEHSSAGDTPEAGKESRISLFLRFWEVLEILRLPKFWEYKTSELSMAVSERKNSQVIHRIEAGKERRISLFLRILGGLGNPRSSQNFGK